MLCIIYKKIMKILVIIRSKSFLGLGLKFFGVGVGVGQIYVRNTNSIPDIAQLYKEWRLIQRLFFRERIM